MRSPAIIGFTNPMSKETAKQETPIDVLVLGEHPAGALAAALLRHKTKLRIVHAAIPGEDDAKDRLVTVNPALFDLHPILAGLKRKLNLTSVHGISFFADDPETHSEYRAKTIVAYVTRYKSIRDEMAKIADTEGVERVTPKAIVVHRLDETGVDVTLGKSRARASAIVLAGELSREQQAMLGLPDSWGPDVVHRFTFIRCKSAKAIDTPAKPLMSMSLDLLGELCWAWLIPGDGEFQLSVEQPIENVRQRDGLSMLKHWAHVL